MVSEIPYLKKIFKGSSFWGGTETSFNLMKKHLSLQNNIVITNSTKADFDLLHIYTYFLLSYYLMRRFKEKKPIVIHSNTTPADIRMSVPFDQAVFSVAKPYLKRIYNLADLVICVSTFAMASLQRLGVTSKMVVLPHGVELDVMKYSNEKRKRFRNRFKLSREDSVILTVGHLIPRKGISTFYNLAKMMPKIKFLWVGPSLISLDPDVSWVIRNRPKNLIFTGYVDDVVSAYSACDVFVFPSYSENFGIPIIEAAACKRPIIVRDVPAYPWLRHEIDCFKAKNERDFAFYIDKILENNEVKNELIEEGNKLAKRHDIRRITKELTHYYKELLC